MNRTTKNQLPVPKRILVVEDEPLVADAIQMAIGGMGHVVEIVNDAENALRMFEVGRYDLVATDFTLPKMNGLDLARAIKVHSREQPVLLISAYAHTGRWEPEEVADVAVVLCKPFTQEELAGTVARALAR